MRRAKTKSPATPAQLRIALENLLADVTGGEISGRNPWSCDSVKRASETLTGQHWAEFNSGMIKETGK